MAFMFDRGLSRLNLPSGPIYLKFTLWYVSLFFLAKSNDATRDIFLNLFTHVTLEDLRMESRVLYLCLFG